VSGTLVKKFYDYYQAKAFVENYKKQKDLEQIMDEDPEWWDGMSNMYPYWAEASVQVIGVSGSIVKKFREFEEVMHFITHFQHGPSILRPWQVHLLLLQMLALIRAAIWEIRCRSGTQKTPAFSPKKEIPVTFHPWHWRDPTPW
jgi:hypothetical protein